MLPVFLFILASAISRWQIVKNRVSLPGVKTTLPDAETRLGKKSNVSFRWLRAQEINDGF